MSKLMNLNAIGDIHAEDGRYYISVKSEFRAALNGLSDFSHLLVIWWGHEGLTDKSRKMVSVDRPYKNGPDSLGIFATRSPIRPNPILISTAAIISVDEIEGIVQLPWIDAENGTPVLDIKPYYPSSDRVSDVSMPAWNENWPGSYEESADFDWSSVFDF